MVEEYCSNVRSKIQTFVSLTSKKNLERSDSLDDVDFGHQSNNMSVNWKFDRSGPCNPSKLKHCQLCEADVLGPYLIFLKETNNAGKDTGTEIQCCRTCVHHLEIEYPENILNAFHKGLQLRFNGFLPSNTGKRKILFEITEEAVITELLDKQQYKKWIPLYKKGGWSVTSYPASSVSFQEEKECESSKSSVVYEVAVVPAFRDMEETETYVSSKNFVIGEKYTLKLSLREWYIYGGGYHFYLTD